MLGASLLFILLVAGYFRLSHNGWDGYHHYHPDERFIAWVGTSIEWPSALATAFQPRKSSFNPYYWPPEAETEGVLIFQDEPRRFAYGHLPLYLGVAATKLAEQLAPLHQLLPETWTLSRYILNGADQAEYYHIVAAARVLTALVDLGTILLTFLLAQRLFTTETALLAALLLALNVMHIQLAHFFTVDPFMTFFVMLTLFFLVAALPREGETPRPGRAYLAAIAFGLAVGSKFSAVYLLFPFLLYARLTGSWRERRIWWHLGGWLLVAAASFALTNPFAVLDWSCTVLTPAVSLGPIHIPPLNWANCYLENIVRQQQMVSGASDLGFTRQYSHTTPFLYYMEMQLKWGMGLPLGLAAFAGLFWALARAGWRLLARRPDWLARLSTLSPAWLQPRQVHRGELILLAWIVPYFLTTGFFFVKFMRYMQPIVPLLMILGAGLLVRPPNVIIRYLLSGTVIVVTALYTIGFNNLYASPHPWDKASFWMFEEIPAGSLILDEQWDDPLPTTQRLLDGTVLSRTQYEYDSLTWLTGADANDTVNKLTINADRLADADYLVIASNRIYGVIPRISERYPIANQYHELLFTGQLGYELVYFAARGPNWGGYHLWPDPFAGLGLTPPAGVDDYLNETGLRFGRFDESFTVYDQPLAMIWRNSERLSTTEILARFDYDE